MKERSGLRWKTNKWFVIHLSITLVLLLRVMFLAGSTYGDLITVSGTIDSVSYERSGRDNIFKLVLSNDKRFFYQHYESRYHDDQAPALKAGDPVTFYSTKQHFEVRKTIISYSRFTEFDYYPVFNINGTKNLFDVFLFYFYRSSWWTILLYIGIVGSLLYSAQYVMSTTWRGRIIPLLLAAIFVWLMY